MSRNKYIQKLVQMQVSLDKKKIFFEKNLIFTIAVILYRNALIFN